MEKPNKMHSSPLKRKGTVYCGKKITYKQNKMSMSNSVYFTCIFPIRSKYANSLSLILLLISFLVGKIISLVTFSIILRSSLAGIFLTDATSDVSTAFKTASVSSSLTFESSVSAVGSWKKYVFHFQTKHTILSALYTKQANCQLFWQRKNACLVFW